jgi:hypothetical protein
VIQFWRSAAPRSGGRPTAAFFGIGISRLSTESGYIRIELNRLESAPKSVTLGSPNEKNV